MRLQLLEIETTKYNFCFYDCVITPIGNVETSYNVDEFWGNISTFKEYEVDNLEFEISFGKVVVTDDSGEEVDWDDLENEIDKECYDTIKSLYYREFMEELIANQ